MKNLSSCHFHRKFMNFKLYNYVQNLTAIAKPHFVGLGHIHLKHVKQLANTMYHDSVT